MRFSVVLHANAFLRGALSVAHFSSFLSLPWQICKHYASLGADPAMLPLNIGALPAQPRAMADVDMTFALDLANEMLIDIYAGAALPVGVGGGQIQWWDEKTLPISVSIATLIIVFAHL